MGMSKIKTKRASILHQVIMHLILIGLIFGLFFMASVGKVNSRSVKQQVLEKQTALLIDSSTSGTTLIMKKLNSRGKINSIEVKEGKVFIGVEGLKSIRGYPYFSEYKVFVTSDSTKFYINIQK